MIVSFLEWLAQTQWSIALHESQYVWPFTESLHVLTLALFVGTAIVLDLRLLRVGYTPVPASEVVGRLLQARTQRMLLARHRRQSSQHDRAVPPQPPQFQPREEECSAACVEDARSGFVQSWWDRGPKPWGGLGKGG